MIKQTPIQTVKVDEYPAKLSGEFHLSFFSRIINHLPEYLPVDPLHDDERLAKNRVVVFQYVNLRNRKPDLI